MSVTNYTPDGCRYSIGKLVNAVYLVSENALKDIRIDNGDAYINSISESPIKLDCYGINLSEEESLDERYKFIHTLKFSVNGYANKDDFQGKYYVIVKDEEGTYWFVNPLFPVKVTYTYTLGYQQNHTDFSIATASNHPVLRLYGMSDTDPYQCDGYFLDGIDALWLNEKKYTVHNGNSVKYTNGGFKAIEYNKSSAVFTETFDGENTKHQIDFDVLFSQYKSSWHYNLLEFKDNLYSAVIRTSNGKYALCGFSLGLQPSYTVSADDTIQNTDKIQITLQDAHDAGDPIEFFDSIDYEYLPYKSYEYTSEYDGYECVGEGIAKYLLQKEVDALGNETGNYKALEGYAYRFPGLNIVDTFSSVVTFTSPECGGGGCSLDCSFPSTLTFNDRGCQTYYVKAGTSWSITSSEDYITVSPSTGSANVGYTVSVCNTVMPTSEIQSSTLTLEYCSTSMTVNVNVIQYNGCFQQGSYYEVYANAQLLNVPTTCCVQSVRETTNIGAISTIYNSYFSVAIPENATGRKRTIILLVVFCDGTSANVTIDQSDIYGKWIDAGGTFCVDHDKYKQQNLWTGETESSYVLTPVQRDLLIEVNSLSCYGEDEWLYDWVRVNGFICEPCSDVKAILYNGSTQCSTGVISGTGELSRSDVESHRGNCAIDNVSVYGSTTSIGDGTFSGMTDLNFVRLPDTITSIGNAAFSGCVSMLSCGLPDGLTSIGDSAFTNCLALNAVNIPSTVRTIGSCAFQNCDNFEYTSIPSGVTTIKDHTFYGCDGLTDIELPDTITSIENYAFAWSSLCNIIIRATTPPTLGSNIFPSSLVKIKVPSEYVGLYKVTTGWNTYADKIFSI